MTDIEKIEIRGLTRGEVKKLRKEGITLDNMSTLDEEKREDALDMIFALCCPECDADSLTPTEGMALYARIIKETFKQEGV